MQESHSPILSIIIISTSLKRLIENTPSIFNSVENISHEVILVCQGYELDETLIPKFNNCKTLIYKNNLGIAEARNKGLNVAKGKYVSFLDDDIKTDLDYFNNTLFILDNNYKYIGVIGKISVEGNPNSSLFKKFKREAKENLNNFYLWRLSNGNTILYRRTDLRFDSRLGVGSKFGAFEDTDFLLRISKLGKLCYSPNCIVYHPDMSTEELIEFNRITSYAKGLGACLSKNLSIGGFLFFVSSLLNNIVFAVFFARSYKDRTNHLAAFCYKIYAFFAWMKVDNKK